VQPRRDPGAAGPEGPQPPVRREMSTLGKVLLWLGVALAVTAWIYLIVALYALIAEVAAVLVWIAGVAAGA
jgi:hypothetical protein